MAFLFREHVWQKLLDSAPLTHEIDVEHLLQVLLGDVENGPTIPDASVVNQYGRRTQVGA